ncbi:MAG: OadG family protein [Desulforhopalus sp.]
MIFEGVKLMVVGMTTVMLFLLLMIVFISLVARLTRGATARELDAIEQERRLQALSRKKAKEATSQDADEDIAVIAAAVAAYEVERFAQA